MSFLYTNAVKKIIVGNSTAKAVLYQLADHANSAGTCFPSINCLSKETEFSDRAIKKAVAFLEQKKLIFVMRNKGKRNKYKLLIEINNPISENTSEINTPPGELISPDSELNSPVEGNEVHTNHNINNHKIKKNHNSLNKSNKNSVWSNTKNKEKTFTDNIDLNFFNLTQHGG